MTNSLKKIASDSFYLYITQGLNYILPFLILPYLVTTLSSETFGIFVYSQAVMQIMILFVDFGFNITTTKDVSVHHDNFEKVTELYWSISFIKLIFAIIVFIIAYLFFTYYEPLSSYRTGVILAGISIFGTVFFPMWLFQGLRMVKSMAIISSIPKFIFLPLIFLFVKTAEYVNTAILLHTLVQLFIGVFATFYILLGTKSVGVIKWSYFKLNKLMSFVKESVAIFLSNFAISFYTSGITIILGFFVSTQMVGIYGAIDRIVKVICFGVYAPVSQAAFPTIIRAKSQSMERVKSMIRTLFLGMFVLMSMIILLFFIFENYFIDNFFPELVNYKILLIVSLLSILPISLGGICGQLALIGLGGSTEKKIFSRIYIVVGVASLILSFFCIKLWAIEGAVYSVVLSEVFVFILMLYFCIKKRLLW